MVTLVFPQDVNETAYKGLVRLILEYDSFVFGIHKVLNKKMSKIAVPDL